MALPISYSWRSMLARGMRTVFTVAVIALVVIATTLFWSLIASLKRPLISSGSPDNLVVMRKGATNDGSSQLSLEAFQAIRFFEGIAKDPSGNPLVSPEIVVQPFFHALNGIRENVLVRGVEAPALLVHDQRWALEATPEIEYYKKLSSTANVLYIIVAVLAVLAGIGAMFGATNTMYAAVQARTSEIGTLRALGFSRASILVAFLAESLMTALFAFAVG